MKRLILVMTMSLMSALAIADEKSLYDFSWLDSDKEIYVLQNRKFRKDGTVYLGATGAYNLSQDFLDAYGGSLRAGFFFSEDWGIEGMFAKSTSTESDTAKGVKSQGAFPFYRRIDTVTGAMLMWSPFYSKINTFNQIFYYDWMFGLGAASISTKDNRNLFNTGLSQAAQKELTSESTVGALWNVGLRFYLSTRWSLRLDVTGVTYRAERTTADTGLNKATKTDYFTNYDLGAGLNFAF